MNTHPGDAAPPVAAPPVPVPPPARLSTWGAILTDVHFWVPVVVLAVGLGLLMYLS